MSEQGEHNTAWGLELSGNRLRLAKLVGSDGGTWVADHRELPVPDGWDWSAQALPPLSWPVGRDEPLAVCVCDSRLFYRTIDAPAVNDATLRKMIANQLEALVPAQAGQLVHAWRSARPDAKGRRRVVIAAGRKETTDAITACCQRLGSPADMILPTLWASSALCGATDTQPLLLLHLSEHCGGAAVVAGADVLACGMIDQGPAETVGDAGGLGAAGGPDGPEQAPHVLPASWRFELRQLYQHLLKDLPAPWHPRRCMITGPAGQAARVRQEVGALLGLELVEPSLRSPRCPDDFDLRAWAGPVGAAMSALSGAGPAANLAGARGARRRLAMPSRRWAMVAAWVVATLVALYVVDAVRAGRMDRRLARARRQVEWASLPTELAVGDHLESGGPAPLEALDFLTSLLGEGSMLTKWKYQRGPVGTARCCEVTLAGTVRDDKAFTELLHKLAEAGKVEFKSGKPDQGKFRFEVHLLLAKVPPPSAEPRTQAKAEGPAASQPSGSPPAAGPTEAASQAPPQAMGQESSPDRLERIERRREGMSRRGDGASGRMQPDGQFHRRGGAVDQDDSSTQPASGPGGSP